MNGSVLTRSWSSSGVASCPVMRRSQPRTFSMEHFEVSSHVLLTLHIVLWNVCNSKNAMLVLMIVTAVHKQRDSQCSAA